MAVMMGNLYDALLKAGADGESARKAAEEVANFDLRVSGLESRIDRLEARMDARFTMLEAKVDSRFAIVTWMIGVILTLQILVLGGLLGLLWKLFPAGGLSWCPTSARMPGTPLKRGDRGNTMLWRLHLRPVDVSPKEVIEHCRSRGVL